MSEYTFDVSHMDLFYNDFQALKDINMKIKKNEINVKKENSHHHRCGGAGVGSGCGWR